MFWRKWEPAVGKLLASRYIGRPVPYVYLMEVRPLSGGEVFRCECQQPWMMASFKSPPLHAEIKMECIPSKKKARFDRSEPAIDDSDARARHDTYQALLHATPGAATAPEAGIASDPADQVARRLIKLRDLYEAGELTEQQFEDELTTITQQLRARKAQRPSSSESNEL